MPPWRSPTVFIFREIDANRHQGLLDLHRQPGNNHTSAHQEGASTVCTRWFATVESTERHAGYVDYDHFGSNWTNAVK
jgi:hypothetical protein